MNSIVSFKDSLQIGPWRIGRTHLGFIAIFCIAVISLGVIVLHTQAFDAEDEEDDGDEEQEDKQEYFFEHFSTGDYILFIVMIIAGVMLFIATALCVFVKKNTPTRLSDNQNPQSVYSVQFNNNDAKIHSESPAHHNLAYSSEHIQQPHAENRGRAHNNGELQRSPNHKSSSYNYPLPLSVNGLTGAVASAPQLEQDNPPPYSP